MPEHRQLAAIMFTDIVGYTAMMQKNEQHAISLLDRHQSILEKKIHEHNGEMISYYGDGSLSMFSSITQALQCAIEIQEALLKDPHVPLRIGLHIGEVLVEGGNIVGDAVNLTSRIQSLGKAGTILFSKDVFEKIRNRQHFKAVSLGSFMLKNVEEPMEIFALANDGIVVPDKRDIAGMIVRDNAKKNTRLRWVAFLSLGLLLIIIFFVLPFMGSRRFTGKEKSIAVLPFKNISNDTMQEYFSDGITEDIITQLSKIADLRVISSSSIMQYKNDPGDIQKIARELNVASVLEGSIRREGNQVRITAQLIDAKSNQHIWANNYDKNVNEVFAIQSEVAQQIATELDVKLTKDEGNRIQNSSTKNMAAYEDYLLARQANWADGERLLLSALQKDSTFALAWSALAFRYTKKPITDSTDRPYYIRKSLDAALTAVHYGPEQSETHMILGDVLKTITLNPNLSINELNKSISLNPNNAEAYVYLAFALSELGRFNEAEKNLTKAKQLDPLSLFMKAAWTLYYYYSRNTAKLDAYMDIFNSMPGGTARPGGRITLYFLKDQYDSILRYGDPKRNVAEIGIALAKTGKIEQAEIMIDSLKKSSETDNAFNIGIIYAWMGDKQKAMQYLTIAYRVFDYGLISIKVNKLFDPLRDDDAFKNLLYKMGMK
jgi:adenylate cyclase